MRRQATRAWHAAPPHGGAGLAVYYGYGQLERLAGFQTVVLQPGAYPEADLQALRERGVRVLAYLSLGEEVAGADAAWHLPGLDPTWGTRRVRANHPRWRAMVLAQVRALRHYDGYFLDTIDSWTPQEQGHMLALIAGVRRAAGRRYLLANRGATLLPALGNLVNGVLIEALSTTWEAGYRAHDRQGLEFTAALLERARACGLDTWGLDYAEGADLQHFAQRRAATLGVETFVSRRSLDVLPGLDHAEAALASTPS